MQTPDYTQPFYSIRFWRYDGLNLRSPIVDGHIWNIGINTAVCDSLTCMGAPGSECECGLYGYFSPRHIIGYARVNSLDAVIGLVAHWGKIQLHLEGLGLRSEYAEIKGLCKGSQPLNILTPIANHYNVPILSVHELVQPLKMQIPTIQELKDTILFS